jgi:hypothetical protein
LVACIEREASVVVVVEKCEVFRGRKQKAADVFAKWTRPHFAGWGGAVFGAGVEWHPWDIIPISGLDLLIE